MKVNSEIVRGVLRGTFSDTEDIIHRGKRYTLSNIVCKLVIGLNDLNARVKSVARLKAEQVQIDADHIGATCEIDDEIVSIQDECPHFSFHEVADMDDHSNVITVVICDTCGKLLEQEIGGCVEVPNGGSS